MSIQFQDTTKEADRIAHFSQFAESIFAVKFSTIRKALSQLQMEVKQRVEAIRVAPNWKVEDQLNVFFKYINQLFKKTTLLIRSIKQNILNVTLPDFTSLLPMSSLDDAFQEGFKNKQEFLSQPKMVEFLEDVHNGLTVKQLMAKYRSSQTKIDHMLQLIQKSAPNIPEPPYETYEQLNKRLKAKLFTNYRDTKLHFIPEHSDISPEELQKLAEDPPSFRRKRTSRRKKQPEQTDETNSIWDEQLNDIDLNLQ